jgi:hypothetical protein
VLGFLGHLVNEVFFCLLARHSGNLLKLPPCLVDLARAFERLFLNLRLARLESGFTLAKIPLTLVNALRPFVDHLLFADQPLFLILQLTAGLPHFPLKFGLFSKNSVLRLYLGLFPDSRGVFFCLFDDSSGRLFGRLPLALILFAANPCKNQR